MIGVVGSGDGERIADALEGAGVTVLRSEVREVTDRDPDLVVAVGEDDVIDLAREGFEGAFLPIEAGFGPLDWSVEEAIDATDSLETGAYRTVRSPTFEITRGGDRVGRAVFDTTLVTGDPARISGYRIEHWDPVAQFRSDGVVIATPAGSHGYARASGGPVVETESDLATVVPIGAFTMARDHWTLDLTTPVEITVTREESGVSLVLDGREVGTIAAGERITVRPDDAIRLVRRE